jgi:hypothetical protein
MLSERIRGSENIEKAERSVARYAAGRNKAGNNQRLAIIE